MRDAHIAQGDDIGTKKKGQKPVHSAPHRPSCSHKKISGQTKNRSSGRCTKVSQSVVSIDVVHFLVNGEHTCIWLKRSVIISRLVVV